MSVALFGPVIALLKTQGAEYGCYYIVWIKAHGSRLGRDSGKYFHASQTFDDFLFD